jgi:acetyl esterase/lipase
VDTKDFHTQTSDGHNLLLRWYTKSGAKASEPSSALVYSHGGGYISCNIDNYDTIIKGYVSRTGVPLLAPEYRLVPEVKNPTPVTDVYAGLQYLHSHAGELGVDTNRIGIMGDSAGGGITASLAHYVKSKGGPAVKKQILIYPMLDDKNLSASTDLAPYCVWSVDDNITGWSAALDGKPASGPETCNTKDHVSDENISPMQAAGRMTVEDAKGLPPTYIDTGELDLFRDEDLEYAKKLGQAGISCETHVFPGVPHCFELFAPQARVSKECLAVRDRVIKDI